MKRIFILTFVIFATAVFVNAQQTPPGAADSDLRDNNVRLRSNELERIKREANKSDPGSAPLVNPEIESKFPQIKEDFEGLQIAQMAIVKAYSTGENIDYKLIESSSSNINKSAKRLDSNLFTKEVEIKKDKSKEKEEKSKSVRDLIVELDNAIGNFVTSPLFQNLRIIEPEVAKKSRTDLAAIIKASGELSKAAEKMK